REVRHLGLVGEPSAGLDLVGAATADKDERLAGELPARLDRGVGLVAVVLEDHVDLGPAKDLLALRLDDVAPVEVARLLEARRRQRRRAGHGSVDGDDDLVLVDAGAGGADDLGRAAAGRSTSGRSTAVGRARLR